MVKQFNDMEIGENFLNQFTHTLCVKVNKSSYFDFTLKKMIRMRPELKESLHMIIRGYTYDPKSSGSEDK